MKYMMRLVALAGALLVGACAGVPLGSLVRLSQIDFDTTDLAALRVALRLPEALRPRPGGVNMDVVTKVSGAAEQTVTYRLDETLAATDFAGLPPSPPGFVTTAYRLSDEDIGRFGVLRQKVRAVRQAGGRGTIGMGIATREFCLTRVTPVGPLPTTTWLLTSETGGYVMVTEGLDLRQNATLASEFAAMEPCLS